jgi:hypothetical protein
MKDATDLMQKLFSPYKKDLNRVRCLRTLKALLPPRFAKHITGMVKKNGSVMIIIDNFTLKQEFNYQQNVIKSLLKQIASSSSLCHEMQSEKIVIWVKVQKNVTQEEKILTYHYPERSTGEFETHTDDPELQKLYEEIKAAIRKQD